jgi:endoglucanase
MPHQIAAHNRGTGTDANAIQIARAGVVTGLISIPNRYMHSAVETIALDDIDRAADLLATFVSGLVGDEDFTP